MFDCYQHVYREQDAGNNLPVFSPDGSHLAFIKWRNTADGDIWLADPDGRNATQLTANPAMESMPSWLPGGDRLAFLTDRTGHREVWSIPANGGPETPLRDVDPDLEYARLSPDGTRLAFHLRKGGMMNVWVAPVGPDQPKQLTFDRELMGFPCLVAAKRPHRLRAVGIERQRVGHGPGTGEPLTAVRPRRRSARL